MFQKAVLWKDKQLSLRPFIITQLNVMNVKKLNFIDDVKKEKWTFSLKQIVKYGVKKTVGQEEQIYFSIDLAKKTNL